MVHYSINETTIRELNNELIILYHKIVTTINIRDSSAK